MLAYLHPEKKELDNNVDLADTMKRNKETKERLVKERLERNRKVIKDANKPIRKK